MVGAVYTSDGVAIERNLSVVLLCILPKTGLPASGEMGREPARVGEPSEAGRCDCAEERVGL